MRLLHNALLWRLASLFTLLLSSSDVLGFTHPSRSRHLERRKKGVTNPLRVQAVPLAGDPAEEPVSFALDPTSELAQQLLSDHLGLNEKQQNQVANYCYLMEEWNQKINLMSRKECNQEIIFGRHVLPCLSPILLENGIQEGDQVVDVGTGGGLPGIPLAICHPECTFLLVDSVGKKLKAVNDMVERLGLTNIKTLHARAEEISGGKFDWCVGRSVSSLPKFCGWINHLLEPEGKLLYIIGGEVPEASIADAEYSIQDLISSSELDLGGELISDKRLLLFPQQAVQVMAASTAGDGPSAGRTKPKTRSTQRDRKPKKKETAKGAWRKSSGKKSQGGDAFQRYSSN